MSETLDLAIVGAGPAGLAAAIRARARGLRVVVLSKARGSRGRGESLSPAAKPVLQQLGHWERFVAEGHSPCPGNQWSWGDDELRHHSFTMDPRGSAWHVDRERFDRGLREHAARSGARLVELRRTPRVDRTSDGAWVLTPDAPARPVVAGALVDASGRGASIARGLGARRVRIDPQVAVVVRHRPHGPPLRDRSSLVEAVPEGWWYSAREPGGDLAVLLFTTRPLGVALASDPDRLAALRDRSRHTAARTRGHELDGKPAVVDASCEHLDVVGGPGWRAVGDAALTYDPLASHGLTFALASGRDAADSLADALHGDGEASRERYAATIERARHGYLAARRTIYAAERRWSGSPYWSSRGGDDRTVRSD